MSKTNLIDYVGGMKQIMNEMKILIKKYEDWIKKLEVKNETRR